MTPRFLQPDWPAPARIRAACTTRQGGVSLAPYASFNLAIHVGDQAEHVQTNRQILQQTLQLPAEPAWLTQVHGKACVDAAAVRMPVSADASFTRQSGVVCVVMTADCLPVLFCDRAGSVVAAAHAGWRGLLDGVLESTLATMAVPPGQIMAWLGPAIGPQAFEVGAEVYAAFTARDPGAEQAFVVKGEGKWFADLYQLARLRLQAQGVSAVYGGDRCTYREADDFYSYRREAQTGRMASLIWREE